VRAWQTAEIFATAFKISKQKIRKTELLLPGSTWRLFLASCETQGRRVGDVFRPSPHLDEAIAAGCAARATAQFEKGGCRLPATGSCGAAEWILSWLCDAEDA